MPRSVALVDFEGAITFGTIEMLLNKLRSAPDFEGLQKPTKKRLYSIFVESIDNIFKYGVRPTGGAKNLSRQPRISVTRKGKQFRVRSGNLVLNEDIGELKFRIDRVNQLDNEALKSLYEEVINKESRESDTGAGLGLITMAMRTESDIEYEFKSINEDYSFFELTITING
jgi:hypothetical protein